MTFSILREQSDGLVAHKLLHIIHKHSFNKIQVHENFNLFVANQTSIIFSLLFKLLFFLLSRNEYVLNERVVFVTNRHVDKLMKEAFHVDGNEISIFF